VIAASLPAELTEFADLVTARLRILGSSLSEPLRSPVSALASRPGKCLRAMLLAACAQFGSAGPERLIRLGALVELLHLASLLHDDVIDRAAVRRGGPAAQTVIGSEGAVLAGLACFALAGLEAAELGGGLDQLVGRTVAGLAYGEMLDVERAFDTRLSLPDYLELAERKTGDLFRLSCLLGAAEADAGEDVALALAQFGADFGVAFQILDDCLDFRPGGEGKPAGTDHLMGLFGAPTLCALAGDESGELARLLLTPGFSERDMPAVRELVIANGGLAAAATLARERYARALGALDGIADPGGGRRDLLVTVTEIFWLSRQ
jgi:geranylgeranyl pyrophosphate synthase